MHTYHLIDVMLSPSFFIYEIDAIHLYIVILLQWHLIDKSQFEVLNSFEFLKNVNRETNVKECPDLINYAIPLHTITHRRCDLLPNCQI